MTAEQSQRGWYIGLQEHRLILFTEYAEARLRRRRLDRGLVVSVLESPEQIVEDGERKVAQSRFSGTKSGRDHLLRVVYEDAEEDKLVITVYETTKIRKYWRAE